MVIDLVVTKTNDGYTAEIPSIKDVKAGHTMKIMLLKK